MTYDCSHSLCNTHLIPALTYIYEEGGQPWVQQIIGLLLESKEAVEQAKKAGKKRLAPCDILEFENRYETTIAAGMEANPPPGSCTGTPRATAFSISPCFELIRIPSYGIAIRT